VAGQLLAGYVREERPITVRIREGGQEQSIELPVGAVALLIEMLETLATGQGVTIVPGNAELTTVEAAEVLNVSRPFLIKLLDAGEIPHRKVGKHRRIRTEDILAYKERDDREREAVLDRLAGEAQEQDMGYRRP
jgi:excisionase family DNA binding protein